MEMADRIAVLHAGRIEQVDKPAVLYAEPATAFVHEFMGESLRFDCLVSLGRARIVGLCDVELPTTCSSGPGAALIRPHEVGLLPGPGPARVQSQQFSGAFCRVRVTLGDKAFDVLTQPGTWTPAVNETCNLDLSRARFYTFPLADPVSLGAGRQQIDATPKPRWPGTP
jgi:ABC-type Fe3+/spermidine/putrescine transport system ATPase subunit